jgi:putative nucleotidyltransferase with HDIG domain
MTKQDASADSKRLAMKAMTSFSKMYQLAYASVSPSLTILRASANFKSILQEAQDEIEGCPLIEVLPELVGSEDALQLVLYKAIPSLDLEMILHELQDGTLRFISMHVFLLDESIPGSGLLFLAEDVTHLGMTAQKLIHQRNETRLIREALARAYADLEMLTNSERHASEEALRMVNLELQEAYDRTMEGWVRALDLRDRETEGHTLRVAEVTVRLARAFGISEAEINHIPRGALLHDIGKMGVPDRILLRAGKLNDEEWEIMRNHPNYALEMLSPISYLHKAIDIPFNHHEKWDGSGYPRGLAGEEIPLAARLFTVVDVWDALLSSRSYRKGWPYPKVMEYIRENANGHFDPNVVALFQRVAEEMAHEI